MTKLDLKSLDHYRAAPGVFRTIEVPAHAYLMLDGAGDPNTAPSFTEAVETLFPVAYALKFLSKGELARDYVVPPLEGLWWAEDVAVFTTARNKSAWRWTLLLLVPDWLGPEHVGAAIERVAAKRARPPRLAEVRVETLVEGTCVQTLHIGPFDDEGPVLARLHEELLPRAGLRPTGRHHEIYLSDFRRVEPARRRTILRQPVTAS